jgi:hypothetical protein
MNNMNNMNTEYDFNPKISEEYLEKINKEDCVKFFGNWINNIDNLKTQYVSNSPFDNIVIDNFLENSYAEKIYELFPNYNQTTWHTYENPLEVKYTFDDINGLPDEIKNIFYILSSNKILNLFSEITGIDNLEYDKYLHGAGLHSYPRNGRLSIHLDYEKHPLTGKERRVNIILFMTKNWDDTWNGDNQLWDNNASECILKTHVKFNRAVIFKTNDISWHGVPDKINCPTNVFRNSIAYYYVSPLNTLKDENNYRKKAKFVRRPEDVYCEKTQKLYEIRPYRRITKKDLIDIFPEWTVDT